MFIPSLFSNDFADSFFNDFFDSPIGTLLPERAGGQVPAKAVKPFDFMRANVMRVDVKELENSYEVDMQLPGYAKEDIEVEIKDGYLTVSADHEENVDEQNEEGKYIRKECYRGSCKRSMYVGDHVTKENVEASFKDGMLILTFPKQESLPKDETKQLVEIS
jgi:HSP20 family protein